MKITKPNMSLKLYAIQWAKLKPNGFWAPHQAALVGIA